MGYKVDNIFACSSLPTKSLRRLEDGAAGKVERYQTAAAVTHLLSPSPQPIFAVEVEKLAAGYLQTIDGAKLARRL